MTRFCMSLYLYEFSPSVRGSGYITNQNGETISFWFLNNNIFINILSEWIHFFGVGDNERENSFFVCEREKSGGDKLTVETNVPPHHFVLRSRYYCTGWWRRSTGGRSWLRELSDKAVHSVLSSLLHGALGYEALGANDASLHAVLGRPEPVPAPLAVAPIEREAGGRGHVVEIERIGPPALC